ncbi:hypothetical protein HETIRDRAFT_407870 [Heterobasidion irregulare TC 32-1]|uniref:Elongin-A n=1 Tax=Heterobasidion irregulare (strain TC 32-1) TaxID=747525 RepID=W4KM50_HETIT|nr:uncharacterized protein HETIRDRAFT_407870 [Heterobasidion irregulare TC 32-1]ETW86141.1 hypothetical protein HETIRDRAFT_407870 [Heterobasidion irregulare TC 32-1]
MSSDADMGDTSARKIPTLVQYCQRVAASHVNEIESLGEDVRYDLVRPVLEHCSADTLLRLENSTPNLDLETDELWKYQCMRAYPAYAHRYSTGVLAAPPSWKEHFSTLREQEAKRFEEIGSRIRNARMEEQERKREREIKFTDNIPPAKRARGWNVAPPRKTLFQQTKTEASKIQKSVFGPAMRPPMIAAKSYCCISPITIAKPPLSSPPPPSGSRVVVRHVVQRRPSHPDTSSLSASGSSVTQKLGSNVVTGQTPTVSPPIFTSPPPRPPKSISTTKKDAMSALFMPKHRAHSQLPSRLASSNTPRI